MRQEQLFDSAAGEREVPLAERMRPKTLEEFVGQRHVMAPDKALGRLLGARRLQSLTLWGAPGCGKTTLARLIAQETGAYLIGLSAVTAGVKEVRAWTIPVGATAPQAAAVIHTDFEKGFIRAQVIAYDEFIRHGGEQPAKEAGRMRSEGKEYVVQDGDVMHFLFNV